MEQHCQPAKHIETVQNRGLRYITGAFCTTPISAMQIEASIPPITLTLDYAVKRKANAIHKAVQRIDPQRSSKVGGSQIQYFRVQIKRLLKMNFKNLGDF